MKIILQNRIPDSEIRVSFTRSSGAGGQNVNKTSTKATVHWQVGESQAFSDEEKILIRTRLVNRVNSFDEIVVSCEEERSQSQNREKAEARLQSLVSQAVKIFKKRRPTRPTRASREKRLEGKKRRSAIKISRQKAGGLAII